IPVLPLDLDRKHVGQGRTWPAWLLLDTHVARSQVELQARRRRDGPERIVRGQLDAVRLAPPRHLARFGDAADDAQVDPAVVDQILVDQLAELPFAGELLAGRERHRCLFAQASIATRVFRTERVLHEERTELLAGAAQSN